MDLIAASRSRIVKEEAAKAGFDFCGISKAEFLEEEAPRLEQWLSKNMHGEMAYMTGHFDKRLDPRLLVPGAKSIVSLLYNYFPGAEKPEATNARISNYAYGEDYHVVVQEKLNCLMDQLRARIGDVNGRVFVDSAPVLERAWAAKSGIGWIGKNSNLITRKHGSFFFLAELIIDVSLEADGAIQDYCGSCTRCIDACPTDAIVEPYVVDGSKCISYFTIELKNEIPESMRGKFDHWVFGCDICQEVCPWNRFSKPHNEKRFEPSGEFISFFESGEMEISEERFQKIFNRSAVKRTGYKGLKRNLDFIRKTS